MKNKIPFKKPKEMKKKGAKVNISTRIQSDTWEYLKKEADKELVITLSHN